jgi:uncharacterized tellurite resistance protein B-like protein
MMTVGTTLGIGLAFAPPYRQRRLFAQVEYAARKLPAKTRMITSIKEFFTQLIEPGTRQAAVGSEHALQIATAALLLEMMRMDERITSEERTAIATALRQEFNLDAAQLDTLIALAEQQARQASDYYQFTSLINKACDTSQKIRIVENLWQVALADGHLDAHELHLMRKIADLLYISHADYIAAKQRARVAAGVPPGS